MCDEVSETQRKLDMNLNQWASYDESFDAIHKWLIDAEVKLKQEAELKATLPEKKAQLQNHKVLAVPLHLLFSFLYWNIFFRFCGILCEDQ